MERIQYLSKFDSEADMKLTDATDSDTIAIIDTRTGIVYTGNCWEGGQFNGSMGNEVEYFLDPETK